MTLAALLQQNKRAPEAWRYTSLAPWEKVAFGAPVHAALTVDLPPALSAHRLVFVDGVLIAGHDALPSLPDALVMVSAQDEPLAAPHYSLSLGGQACLAIDPVELLFITTDNATPTQASTRLSISLGENSRLTLIERHSGGVKKAGLRQVETQITLAPQSKLVHGKIVDTNGEALHIAQTKVSVAAGAFYDHFGLIADGRLTRCETDVVLQGALAEARMMGAMLLRGQSHGDITSRMIHAVPNTASRQLCKAVLDGKARGVFQGAVRVDPHAQKTDAYQLCRALLLSPQAEMDAKPELEIYADDVKCSHGTAIGDLEEEALFYLRSRGIPLVEARGLLIEAFIMDMVDQIQSPELAALVHSEVAAWLA